ncbi:MAG: penicillin-binding protein 2 [Thiotrichaceae bacterium]|nr:penicillin-binding protein 2 [Thiotrichaceae bacterium]
MAIRSSIKDENKEVAIFRTRALIAAVFVTLMLFGILTRLFFLQVVQYEHYTQLSRKNYQRRIPIPPVRGEIFDRNGVLLAGNRIEYVLEVTRDEVKDIDDKLSKVQAMMSMSDGEIKKIKHKLRINNRFQPIIIKRKLTKTQIAIFSSNRPRFHGFDLHLQMERYYPYRTIAGHVLGYVGRIDKKDLKKIDNKEYKGTSHIGKSGLEKTYEKLLHGKSGYRLVEVDHRGRHKKLLEEKSPTAGQDLYLTLDINLQTKAEELLSEYNGAAVAINPANGEVLAMASMPVYDPNQFVNGISHRNYSALRDNPDRPLYSRAFQGSYPPGSTIKPMVGIAGLESGVTNRSRSVYGRGFFSIPGNKHRYRCWKKTGHGHVSLDRAIYQSCDVYFYDLAYRMGIKRFSTELKKFGFGQKTGIDLPHERAGLMPTAEWKNKRFNTAWYPGDTVNIGIGQGFWHSTPLQLAQAVGIVAMKGKRAVPHLLRGVRSAKDKRIKFIDVQIKPPLVLKSNSYWDEVIRGMVHVVHGPYGTARKSGEGSAYKFAGKTGTAQVFGIPQNKSYNASKLKKKLHDHSLFVSFAPWKNPQIALAVIAENAGGGSKVAAPLARKILDAYLVPEENIETNDDVDKKEKNNYKQRGRSRLRKVRRV